MQDSNANRRFKEPPVSLELIGVLEFRKKEFTRKFGRAPMPGEPLFFDPEAPEPRRLARDAAARASAEMMALTGLPAKVAANLVGRW